MSSSWIVSEPTGSTVLRYPVANLLPQTRPPICLILTLFQVHPAFPLIVAANRDERRSRPSTPPCAWAREPLLWAGRDEAAGGTWLGVNEFGMVVGVTNRRIGENDPSRPSRGLLCLDALCQASPLQADVFVAQELATHSYNPFNLQCVDPRQGWARDGQGKRWELTPGAHVLTNYGDLDDSSIPVVHRAQSLLQEFDLRNRSLDRLMQTLGRICADQASDPPICRAGGDYGTVSSSLIAVRTDGSVAAYWHAPGPPVDHVYQPLDLERSPLVHSG